MNETVNAVEVNGLDFAYRRRQVLTDLNIVIEPGTIIGLLGKNGGGKTTLINCILGFFKGQGGSCRIFGEPSRNLSGEARQRLAFVPQTNDLFGWMTTKQIVHYVSRFYARWNQPLVDSLLSEWELPAKGVVSSFSVGEAQKLAIVVAMGHEPDLLILDEPVAALDPAVKRKFIRQLVELNAARGSTVLFSTNITADIERAAADVAILRDGKIYFQGGVDELKEKVVKLHVAAGRDLGALPGLAGVTRADISGQDAMVTIENYSESLKTHIEREFDAVVTPQGMGLEDIFVELTAGE